jgi:trk system potassium uptake protein TrkA
MRIAIAGAGAGGRSIAQTLLALSHRVLLIESRKQAYRPEQVPAADWMWADACELSSLEGAGIDGCDVAVATTGDDKVNLVFSYLCKTEFAVPRVIARINDAGNDWLFNASWGVDVGVSAPRTAVAVVESVRLIDEIGGEVATRARLGSRH